VPPEKLPPALRGVAARQLRFAVCCGALLVFEVRPAALYSSENELVLIGWSHSLGYSTLMKT